ncbi:hypothetical protein [Clostridium bowmanii]|nr:hypothetical protein [Clostridium bowmanii]
MQPSLRGIARTAKHNQNYKFSNLYGLLNKDASDNQIRFEECFA